MKQAIKNVACMFHSFSLRVTFCAQVFSLSTECLQLNTIKIILTNRAKKCHLFTHPKQVKKSMSMPGKIFEFIS
jgi:hypothetical protein